MLEPTTSISLYGLRIDEPVTMLTDILVAAVCLYAVAKLRPISNHSRLHKLVITYFLLMGIATFLGGVIGHGFLYAMGFYWKLPGWLLSMLAINFFERVMILYSGDSMSNKQARFFSMFNIVELVIFAALAFGSLNFLFVEIHSTYGLLVVVFGFCLYNYKQKEDKEAVRNLMMGVAMVFISAVIFVAKWQIHLWFNHADLAHIFMAIGAYYFYKGSKKMMQETKKTMEITREKELASTLQ